MRKFFLTCVTVVAVYGASWASMYLFAVGPDTRYVIEYFRLSWTHGSGEIPTGIQLFALGLTVIICAAIALSLFIRAKLISKRSPDGMK